MDEHDARRSATPRTARAALISAALAAGARGSEQDPVAACRAALHSPDPAVALAAALRADPAWLDVAEQRRMVALALPHALTAPSPFDFERFRDALIPSDVSRELILDAPLPRVVTEHLGMVHRALRPEHAALLAHATRSDDWPLRRDAIRYLAVVANGSGAARETVALAILAWNEAAQDPGDVDPLEWPVPARALRVAIEDPRDGLPPTLRAALRRLWFEPCGDELRAFGPFLRRWLLAARASVDDVGLLGEASAHEDVELRRAATAALTKVIAPTSEARLREIASHDADALVAAIARGALARAGDGDARERVFRDAGHGDAAAVAACLTLDPVACAAFGAEAIAAAFDPDLRAYFPLDGDIERDLARGLAARTMPPEDLALLLENVPGLRTATLRTRLLESLPLGALTLDLAPILELTDADALRARLRAAGNPASDELADLRLRLGDPSDGPTLLAIARAHALDPCLLARSASQKLAASLHAAFGSANAERLPYALAAVLGVDERLAIALADEAEELEDDERARRAAVLSRCADAGQARAAVVSILAARPIATPVLRGTWTLCAETPVRSWLERRRDARELGGHADAVAALALGGDEPAREELRSAFALELYPWFDDLPHEVLGVDGVPPDPSRWWRALDGNCCSFAAIASRLEDWYAIDAFRREDGPRSRTDVLRDVFTRHAGEWRYSVILGKFVVIR
ncbi:MAG: hypothetical protein HZB39_10100 [Planctomycetes bacterium]|nr:hypothetical protein [Planctomycetota bacterium]